MLPATSSLKASTYLPVKIPAQKWATTITRRPTPPPPPLLCRQLSKLMLKSYNVCSGKLELESRFPVDVASFLGLAHHNVTFRSTGESEFVSLLLDGNRTVYPIVKDSTSTADSIRFGSWRIFSPVGTYLCLFSSRDTVRGRGIAQCSPWRYYYTEANPSLAVV